MLFLTPTCPLRASGEVGIQCQCRVQEMLYIDILISLVDCMVEYGRVDSFKRPWIYLYLSSPCVLIPLETCLKVAMTLPNSDDPSTPLGIQICKAVDVIYSHLQCPVTCLHW